MLAFSFDPQASPDPVVPRGHGRVRTQSLAHHSAVRACRTGGCLGSYPDHVQAASVTARSRFPRSCRHHADAAVVATPTITHAEIGCRLMELGVDVLVEKPIAPDAASAQPWSTPPLAGTHPASRAPGALQSGGDRARNRRHQAAVFRGPSPERIQPAQPRRRRRARPDDSRHRHRAFAHRLGPRGNPRGGYLASLSERSTSPTFACNFPAAASPISPPAASPPSASASCGCFSRTNIFRSITAARTRPRFTVNPPMSIGFAPLAVTKDEPLRLELENFFDTVYSTRLRE